MEKARFRWQIVFRVIISEKRLLYYDFLNLQGRVFCFEDDFEDFHVFFYDYVGDCGIGGHEVVQRGEAWDTVHDLGEEFVGEILDANNAGLLDWVSHIVRRA